MKDNEIDFENYLARMAKSPRLTSLLDKFGKIVTAESGQPHCHPVLDENLLQHDAIALAFSKIRQSCAGAFNYHYVASLPYILEEQCRFGAGLLLYSIKKAKVSNDTLKVYTLGDASGVMARALTEISKGNIHTLTCSPNQENQDHFYSKNTRPEAYFFYGPFFNVTPDLLINNKQSPFHGGFDVIVEDTTFQMYSAERLEPIFLACRNLKDDGIFVMLEKVKHEELEEYLRREHQKDAQFKKRYFTDEQIEAKKSSILKTMQSQEATLNELIAALRPRFKCALIIWNSGNFYTIAASNSVTNLTLFVESLTAPAIPKEYCYEILPRILFGSFEKIPAFRHPQKNYDDFYKMLDMP